MSHRRLAAGVTTFVVVNGLLWFIAPTDYTMGVVLTADPILHYHFQGDAVDLSPNGLNGIVSGPTLIPDRFEEPEDTAFHFDGVDDFIETPNTDDRLTLVDAWSIVAWVRPHGPGVDFRADPIVWKIDVNGTNRDNYYLAWHTDSTFRAGLERADNDGDLFVLSDPGQPTDEWLQVVAVYDELDLILYVNGEEQGRNTIGNVTPYSGPGPLRIGNLLHSSHGGRGVFDGDIDDVRLFDRRLSDGEVTLLWRREMIPEPGVGVLVSAVCGVLIGRCRRSRSWG